MMDFAVILWRIDEGSDVIESYDCDATLEIGEIASGVGRMVRDP